MCEFKVGDYVACNSNYYGITTKDRPCIVKEVYESKIVVCCVGDDNTYGVLKSLFYRLYNFRPLRYNEMVSWNRKFYYFKYYNSSGVVLSDGFNRVIAPYKEISVCFKGLFI